jgi:hypothetical protein
MKRFMSKKVAAIGLAAGITLGLGGAAFAYFTSSGTGSGSANVGQATALSITGGNAAGLLPGATPTAVSYTMNNTSGTSENFGTVSIDPTSIAVTLTGVGLAAHNANNSLTCPSSDFAVATSASAIGTIPAGLYSSVVGTEPTIQLTETGTNENACQDATLSFTLNAAAGS